MTQGIRPGIGVMTIKELVARARDLYGPKTFAQWRDGAGSFTKLTYEELYENAVSLGAALGALGVSPGGRVAIIGENRAAWAISYLGVLSGAMVAVPLDPQLKDKELSNILNKAGAEVVVTSLTFVPVLLRAKRNVPSLREIINMDDGGGAGIKGWSVALALGKEPTARDAFLKREVTLDNLAVLLFTSGTTGKSKAVMLTHRNLGANVHQVYQALPFDERDVFLSLLPLHHTFEATAGMLVPISAGAAVTYARSYKSRDIVEDIRDAGVTMMCGVPLIYEKMLAGINRAVADAPLLSRAAFRVFMAVTHAVHNLTGVNLGKVLFAGLRRKAGLATLRMFISGAAPLKPEIARTFYYLGLPLLQGYGLTETAPVVSVNPLNRIKFASSGLPIPGVDVRIASPDADGVGEVVVRGENVMVGYYEDDELTAQVLRDGWLYTGDAGWLDRDGYVYITGRIKNVIVTAAGKNVHPEEIEVELDAAPEILEAAVMPMRDAATGREVVGAVVFPDYEYLEKEAARRGVNFDGSFVDAAVREAVNRCCRALADYKRVKVVKIRTEEFPKTTTRKIKRYLFKNGEEMKET